MAAEKRSPGIEALWDRMPVREALQVPPDLQVHLLSLASELGNKPARWRVEARGEGIAEVLGVAHGVPRLLSSVMGALVSLHMDILSLQAHTWTDGTVHLWVRAAHRDELPSEEELARRLERSLSEKKAGAGASRPGLPNPRGDAVPVPVRVRLLEDAGPFHTALEVRCRDRKGLLRDLALCFEKLHLTVTYALVTTVGPMAQDVFHLKDIFGGRVEGTDKRSALLRAVEAVAGKEAP
jgi:[protein-PII] uridylyltransferase